MSVENPKLVEINKYHVLNLRLFIENSQFASKRVQLLEALNFLFSLKGFASPSKIVYLSQNLKICSSKIQKSLRIQLIKPGKVLLTEKSTQHSGFSHATFDFFSRCLYGF